MNDDITIPTGYSALGHYGITGFSRATWKLLVPIRILNKMIEEQSNRDIYEIQATALKAQCERTAAVQRVTSRRVQELENDLARFDLCHIRTWTEHDVDDARVLATRVLKRSNPATLSVSYDLFVAVCLYLAYGKQRPILADVIFWVMDPGWENAIQMLLWMSNFFIDSPYNRTRAADYVAGYKASLLDKIGPFSDTFEGTVLQYVASWRKAILAYEFEKNYTRHGYKKIGRGQVVPLNQPGERK